MGRAGRTHHCTEAGLTRPGCVEKVRYFNVQFIKPSLLIYLFFFSLEKLKHQRSNNYVKDTQMSLILSSTTQPSDTLCKLLIKSADS